MNAVTLILLGFAGIGFIDKIFALKWGLAASFDKGLFTMGSMAVPIIGVCSVGVAFIQRNTEAILHVIDFLPFDSSFLIGCGLAPDMGGYFISEQLTDNHDILRLNGIILAALLGQLTTFQLPVFLSAIGQEEHPCVLKGFIVGIIIIPVGIVLAGILFKVSLYDFFAQFIPLLFLCALMAGGLWKFPYRIVKLFSGFAKVTQWLIGVLFFLAVLGIFAPALAYADKQAVYDALLILFKCGVTISGALVLSEIILKFFRAQLQRLAKKLGVNEVSVICFLMNFSTSLAILPLYSRMDEKGKMINAAFSVSGTYVLGGQFAFVSSVADGYTVGVYIAVKVICGLLSAFIMSKLYGTGIFSKESAPEEASNV